MIIKNGLVFQEDGSFAKKDLYIENGRLAASETEVSDKTEYDAEGLKVLPGLVDVHSHGAFGHDFCDADPEGLKVILKYEKEHGITSYCPTSMTLAKDRLMDIFATATKVEPDDKLARIIGVNMEGPLRQEQVHPDILHGTLQSPLCLHNHLPVPEYPECHSRLHRQIPELQH